MKSKFYTTLGNKLKEIRLEKGMTQKEIAKKLGITRAAIGFYENADRTIDAATLFDYCDALNCDPQEIINYMAKYAKLK